MIRNIETVLTAISLTCGGFVTDLYENSAAECIPEIINFVYNSSNYVLVILLCVKLSWWLLS